MCSPNKTFCELMNAWFCLFAKEQSDVLQEVAVSWLTQK